MFFVFLFQRLFCASGPNIRNVFEINAIAMKIVTECF